MKDIWVIKIVKEIKFEGIWGKLVENKNVTRDNHSQNTWD